MKTRSSQKPKPSNTRRPAVPHAPARAVREEKRAADEHARFLEAQVESGLQMREFIAEHYKDIE
jgi:hypothetical protein